MRHFRRARYMGEKIYGYEIVTRKKEELKKAVEF